MATQDEAKRRWIELCKEFNMRVREIDKITPWSEVEPEWWLEMMEISRLTGEVELKALEVTPVTKP